MISAAQPVPELVPHLERAAEWRLLSQVFSYPGEDWNRSIRLLLDCLREERFRELARTAMSASEPGLWMSVFCPAGPVRARAVAWEGRLQPGYLLAALSSYYGAFAYEPPAAEPPDHLAVLLDFAAWLEVKIAYAILLRDREAEGTARRALETFLSRFVAPVAWPVFRQLEQAGPAFLAAAARLAAERSGPEPETAATATAAWPGSESLEDLNCPDTPGVVQVESLLPDRRAL